jgi:Trypsin-like peptidase domain
MTSLALPQGTEIRVGTELGATGFVVEDSVGIRYVTTCAHVAASFGMTSHDTPVFATRLDGTPCVGTVADWTLFDLAGSNRVDGALVRLAPGVHASNDGAALIPGVQLPNDRLFVLTPRGAIEGIARGVVSGLILLVGGRFLEFDNVLQYEADVRPGDSGSTVVDASGNVVGLHFGGGGGMGYAIELRLFLEAFQARQLAVVL